MYFKSLVFLGAAAIAGAAWAHEGVKDPNVKARMELMGQVKANIGVLGAMAKGEAAFDSGKAEAAKAGLIANAKAIPAAFETEATDPKSEALPAIWENWDDFMSKAAAMEAAVGSVDVSTLESVQGGMRTIGGSCGGCHKVYRVDK
jgi:cytochrome c556